MFRAIIWIPLSAAILFAEQHAFAASHESVVYSLVGSQTDGLKPQDAPIADGAGNFYVTADTGGEFHRGSVFMVDGAGTMTLLHSFKGGPSDGAFPGAALARDAGGNLYGTTVGGGAFSNGIVFRLTPSESGWSEDVLYSFCAQANCADGKTPVGPVTVSDQGVIFGTTQLGGQGAVAAGSGTVFRLDPPADGGAWTHTVIHAFCNQANCTDGQYPFAGRLLLKSGVLYDTTTGGDQGGTLYSLNTDGGNYQVLHTFAFGAGWEPMNGVAADKNGVLYGTALQDGVHDCGIAYSFDPSISTYQTIYSFCGQPNDAASPWNALTVVDSRKGVALYGVARGGRHNKGALYRISSPAAAGDPWTEKVLYSFCAQADCADGKNPELGTLLRVNGAFYGTLEKGGANNNGALFRYGKD